MCKRVITLVCGVLDLILKILYLKNINNALEVLVLSGRKNLANVYVNKHLSIFNLSKIK